MAINAWKGNHFGVTLDVSAFHCHFFLSAERASIESFLSPSCSAALVIITRMPPSLTAEEEEEKNVFTHQRTETSI